jgi:citrate lyase subunit beta/citryl-CoA lyase
VNAVAEQAAAARTLLFVPGHRSALFDKAAAAGADLVVLDLEDAVPPAEKDEARRAVASWLAGGAVAAVRINAAGTTWHEADVAALTEWTGVVVVPKAEDPRLLAELADRLAGATLIALVETARGVVAAPAVAAADGVARLAFGSLDLAAELGVDPDDREAMAPARGALVLASAAAGLPAPVDGVTQDLADDGRLREDVAYAARLGFTGKLCVHPRQVPVAAEALAPTDQDVAWARSVVEAAGDGGVVSLDGRMIDRPVVERARRVLAAAHPGTDEDEEK